MIVDCHTHVWQSPDQLGQLDLGDSIKPSRRRSNLLQDRRTSWLTVPAADAEHHFAQTNVVDKSIVLAFKSKYLRAEVPNRYVSDYVKRFPDKLIGFAGIDPTETKTVEELKACHDNLQLR